MSITRNVFISWSNNGRTISDTVSRSNELADSLDITVPGGSSPLHVIQTIDVSALKVLFMSCDRDLTVKSNSNSAPDATITLKADVPLWWDSESAYFTNPFGSTDVTSLYLTLAAGADATLKMETLSDSTP